MRMKLPILALAAVMFTGAAFADDLNLGGNYNSVNILENGVVTNEGGGPIAPSTLDGTPLPYVYCVGLFTTVNVPADYPDSQVTYNGVVNGTPINNAGEIAWLLDTFGASATTADEQDALQVAIWTVEYNGTGGSQPVTGDPGQGYMPQYEADLTALGWNGTSGNTADLSSIAWLNPGAASGGPFQALVTAVPEPASIVLLGTVTLFALGAIRSKLKLGAVRS